MKTFSFVEQQRKERVEGNGLHEFAIVTVSRFNNNLSWNQLGYL